MKAKYNPEAATKWTRSHRKDEGKCHFESIQIVELTQPQHGKRANVPVELRLYGTGNVNFACLWTHVPGNTRADNPFPNGVYTQGSGRAGGYGYHRPSAAAHEAIRNAGFTLLTDSGEHADIGGVGDSAIEEALCAIAESLGITNYALVRSHP